MEYAFYSMQTDKTAVFSDMMISVKPLVMQMP